MSASSSVPTQKDTALKYAGNGLAVFPCGKDKKPLTKHGFKDATTDRNKILALWTRWPNASIGCATGSVSRCWVLDVDQPDGPATLAALEAKHGPLPLTVEQRTGGGGRQLFFKWMEGREVRNSAGKLGVDIDVRGNGGYAILPHSGHESGGIYTWIVNEPLALAPDWLLDLVAPLSKAPGKPPKAEPKTTPPLPATNTGTTPYGRKALEYEVEDVATTPEGSRNSALNTAAFKLGSLVAGGELDEDEVEEALLEAALAAGLSENEAKATIASGINAGMLEPRTAPATVEGEIHRENIIVQDGNLPVLVDSCEALLMRPDLAPEHRIFQRGGVVVRIATLPSPGFRDGIVYSEDGIARPEGSVVVSPVDRIYIQDVLGRLGSFQRYDARGKGYKAVDVPKSIAETLLARKGSWPYPSLRGVILCPTVRVDGSLLKAEGYDATSGFYLASSMAVTVPEAPTREQAGEAMESLNSLLVNFPFVSDVDRAVVLALILTGIVRPAVENVPLFTITAPVRGSGKSTLVDIAAVLATGRRAAVVAAVRDQEELRKRLESSMLAGDSMVSLDNLNGTLNSDLLCQATTQASVKIRPLGVSQQQEVPNTAVFAANGNNLTIAGDLSRRTLQCKLDPNCERPEEREFEFDPVALAMRRREEYVSAVLIILRAYVVAGTPKMGLSRFASFEPWSDLVRCALVWAGAADPCDSRKEIISDDPELAALEAVLAAWHEAFKDTAMPVHNVVELSKEDESCAELAESITAVASDKRGEIDKQKFGFWLRRNANRIAGGLRLQRSDLPGASARWRVVEA